MMNPQLESLSKRSFKESSKTSGNVVDQMISNLGLMGSSCGEVYGTDANKLQQCNQLANIQETLNKNIGNVSSVAQAFQSIIDMPNNIVQKDPNNKDLAYQLQQQIEQAKYQDLDNNIYGENGLRKRVSSYQMSLSERVNSMKQKVMSAAKTSESIRKAQTLNQAIYDNLQDTMSEIDKNISNKSRLIQINNEAAQKKSKAISTITGLSSIFLFLILGILGYWTKMISLQTAISMIVIGLVIGFIVFYLFRDFPKKVFDEIEKDLVKEGDKLNLAALQWADENCDCPKEKNKKKDQKSKIKDKKTLSLQTLVNHLGGEDEDNIWYKDEGKTHKINSFSFAKKSGNLMSKVTEGEDPNITIMTTAINKEKQLLDKIKTTNSI
jgi:hypothetical protein